MTIEQVTTITCDRCADQTTIIFTDDQTKSEISWRRLQADGITHYANDALDIALCSNCVLDLSDFVSGNEVKPVRKK